MTRKRGYTTKFRPHGATGKRYLLGNIPAGLWTAANTRARRENLSMRATILNLLTLYGEGKIDIPTTTATTSDEAKAS
jgi:hypothetical protein